MFYLISIVYSIAYLYCNNKRSWDIFTRIFSTFNAFQCIYMVYYEMFVSEANGMLSLYYSASDFSIKSLYLFSSYLLVDGIFQLPYLTDLSTFLSVLHHFIGSFGIYLIASNKMGFFLGYYFAFTEISTPFLNLSWYFRKKYLFVIFYVLFTISRILTVPFLLEYLDMNKKDIISLIPIHSFMSFYGSYGLIALNNIWFMFLTKKVFGL